MKITFIRPNLYRRRSSDAMEPLAIAILKSLTPADIETIFYDERLEPIAFDEPTDLVAITVETFTARRAYAIAAAYRRRRVPVVMGGYHPTLLPEECLRHCDAIVQGDADTAWPQLVEDVAANRLQRVYTHTSTGKTYSLSPDRSIFQGKRYAPVALVQYSRGCKFNCDFCSIRAFYGSHLMQRPVGEVVDEIRRLRRRHVFIVDDNIFVNPGKAAELFEALIPLKIRWSCQISIDITRYPELVGLMKRSGCLTAVLGFESLEHQNLKQMNKHWNVRWSDYETSIDLLQKAGIMIYGTFVFGYDHDTPAVFHRTVAFARRHKFYLANFNPLTPTPATPLYDRLQSEGRLLYDHWWIDPAFRYGQAVFRPHGMTPAELTDGCFSARRTFNSYGSIWNRLFRFKTNCGSPYRAGLYVASNLISRLEIHRKQGRELDTASRELQTAQGYG